MKDSVREKLNEHLKGMPPAKVEALERRLGGLPAERLVLFLDAIGTFAGQSLRAAVEFVRMAPEAGRILTLDELGRWIGVGARLTVASPTLGVEFLQASAEVLKALPHPLRHTVLELAERQAAISGRVALGCFRSAPSAIGSMSLEDAAAVYAIALNVSRRSATQSADLLATAPRVIARLHGLDRSTASNSGAPKSGDADERALLGKALALTEAFARRAGGIAVEFFTELPERLVAGSAPDRRRLLEHSFTFLERGGGAALQFFRAGAGVLAQAGPRSLDQWADFSLRMAAQGNAAIYSFLKSTPKVIAELQTVVGSDLDRTLVSVLGLMEEIREQNAFLALECFKTSPQALATASMEQFSAWAHRGIQEHRHDARRAHAYFALETNLSRRSLRSSAGGVALESVAPVLGPYVESLCGRALSLRPGRPVRLSDLVDGIPIGTGKDIEIPSFVGEFREASSDFRVFKIWAAFAAAQVEFGTFDRGTPRLFRLLVTVEEDFRRHLSGPGGLSETDHALFEAECPPAGRDPLPEDSRDSVDFGLILSRFGDSQLARRIFTIVENGRLDRLLRLHYRGLARDLDVLRDAWMRRRPEPERRPPDSVIPEMLFRLAVGGGVDESIRASHRNLISILEQVLNKYLSAADCSVEDSLEAVYRIYKIVAGWPVESAGSDQPGEQEQAAGREESEQARSLENLTASRGAEAAADGNLELLLQADDGRDGESRRFHLRVDVPERSGREEQGELDLDPGDRTYLYDEWDRELADFRASWCRIIERSARRGGRQFVEQVRDQYASLVSAVRYQFQLMRPEALMRIRGELDGEDFDLQAVIDRALDRRTTGRISDRLYIRRLRKQRDVAVSFLLDMSSSTARAVSPSTLGSGPRTAKRIIDIEKEGLVLMSEALEAVGDLYAVYGFTSEGRRNVKFYVVKDFSEHYGAEVESRIGGITYQNNTRLGAAIRHSAAKLIEQTTRTKLLIVLSDGRPYDHDYGDSRYAREDTKVALRDARTAGVTPFCITIDRESELHLRDLYGEIGYTIIDDVLTLPERLPGIYRRLTA